ncbi:hypothetical protein DFJ74DRAFT_766757 [Hyaloraphidium curvatum]|nr:hypothetical protein DFJ74DRAFT_766757 [Hyaloraphidium curvatum]
MGAATGAALSPFLAVAAAAVAAAAVFALRRRAVAAPPPAPFDLARVAPHPAHPADENERTIVAMLTGAPYRAAMGLAPLDPAELLLLDCTYWQRMADRLAHVRDTPADVMALLPGGEGPAREYLDFIAAFLCTRYPACFARDGRTVRNALLGVDADLDAPDPLPEIAKLVPDDVMFLSPAATPRCPEDDADGLYRYQGGLNVYAFPGEMMRDKLGLPMGAIHQPVPGFNGRILRPVDGFFKRVTKPMVRQSYWQLQDFPEHLRPTFSLLPDTGADPDFDALHFRMERQTFLRLPRSGALAFGVRTYVYHLRTLVERLEREELSAGQGGVPFAHRLYAAVRSMERPMEGYKSHQGAHRAVRRWLEAERGLGDVDYERVLEGAMGGLAGHDL